MANAQIVNAAWQPSGGSVVQLKTIRDLNITTDKGGEVEPEFGLGPRAFGWSDGPEPSYMISFNALWTKGSAATQEYDWITAAREREEGTFYFVKGSTVDTYRCKVVKAEQPTDAKGNVRIGVSISALYVQPG